MDKDRDDQGDIVGIRTVAQQDESVQDSADDNAADEQMDIVGIRTVAAQQDESVQNSAGGNATDNQMDIVGIRTVAANRAKVPKELKGSLLWGSSVCRDPRKPK